jgi:hypothetical protein
VSILPSGLESVTAYDLHATDVVAFVIVGDEGFENFSGDIRFAGAGRAGASFSELWERVVAFVPIIPCHGQFLSDDLNVDRLLHGEKSNLALWRSKSDRVVLECFPRG